MYSVLIAEDELLERRMLEKIVQKEFAEVDRILLAEHGLEALSLARAYRPDILLVDINMPGMDGLKLIHALRLEAFDGQIIIITAYDEFLYAKQAIDHGVVGYLLKPVSVPSLHQNMDKCFARIREHVKNDRMMTQTRQTIHKLTTYIRPQLMREMLSGVVPELSLRTICGWPEEERLQCTVIWLSAPEGHEAACTRVVERTTAAFAPFFSFISIWEGENLFLIMQPLDAMAREQMQIVMWLLAQRLASLDPQMPPPRVSPIAGTYEGLRDTLARKTTFYPVQEEMPEALLAAKDVMPPKERRARRKKALMRLKEGDAVRVLSLYSRLIDDPAHCWLGVYLLVEAYRDFADGDALVEMLCRLHQGTALRTVRSFLADVLNDSAFEKNDNAILENAIAMMRTQYGSPSFSQAWLAEELGLSQAYFSRLFKKATGTSFVAMLTDIRMARAQVLLQGGAKVRDVARACGYQSAKYFADTFRQHFGISPHQCSKAQASGETR